MNKFGFLLRLNLRHRRWFPHCTVQHGYRSQGNPWTCSCYTNYHCISVQLTKVQSAYAWSRYFALKTPALVKASTHQRVHREKAPSSPPTPSSESWALYRYTELFAVRPPFSGLSRCQHMALNGIRSNIRLKDGVEGVCESGICRRDEEDLWNILDLVEEQLIELTRGMITKIAH